MSFETMKKRALWTGDSAKDRMVKGKKRSFDSVVQGDTYQSEVIVYNDVQWKCLLNPDKVTDNANLMEISITYDAGMQNGEVFYWVDTDSYWLVYKQQLSERAYFRAAARKCNYEMNVDGVSYHVAVTGPQEKSVDEQKKSVGVVDNMNYSLSMYITKDERTSAFFKRLNIVKFDGHRWKTAVVDRYSMDGVLHIYFEEYGDNPIEERLENAELATDETTTEDNADIAAIPAIIGGDLIRQYSKKVKYEITNTTEKGIFKINNNKAEIVSQADGVCFINILGKPKNKFVLSYITENNQYDKEVTIDYI